MNDLYESVEQVQCYKQHPVAFAVLHITPACCGFNEQEHVHINVTRLVVAMSPDVLTKRLIGTYHVPALR